MLTAAAAWDGLAKELHSSAAAYGSVISGLTTTGWRGPSSMMMADAVAPYVAWLHGTAAQAEQTATQARTAAGAYQSAFAMTVPPPLIEANRTQLQSLVASNFFGQNSPAIAATEAHYEEMWAQDAAAMYGYASSSSAASRLTPFAAPPHTTNPAGLTAQTAAVAHAAGSPAQAATPQLLAQLPTAMQQLAAPTASADPPGPLDYLLQIPSTTSAAASISSSSFSGASVGTTNNAIEINALRDVAQGIGPFLAGSSSPLVPAGPANLGVPAPSAVMGRASLVGTLSVPQTWAATATPPVNPTALALPTASAAAAPAAAETMPGAGMFGEALLGTLAGRGVSSVAAKMHTSVIPRSPAAG